MLSIFQCKETASRVKVKVMKMKKWRHLPLISRWVFYQVHCQKLNLFYIHWLTVFIIFFFWMIESQCGKIGPPLRIIQSKRGICLETEHSDGNSSAARDMKCGGGGEYCEQLVKYLLWFQEKGSGRMPLPTFGRPQPPAAARKDEFDCKYISLCRFPACS